MGKTIMLIKSIFFYTLDKFVEYGILKTKGGAVNMKVKLQRRNRYSQATCTERESIVDITVDIENGTAK